MSFSFAIGLIIRNHTHSRNCAIRHNLASLPLYALFPASMPRVSRKLSPTPALSSSTGTSARTGRVTPNTLGQNVPGCILVTVMRRAAPLASPAPLRELQLSVQMTTGRTGLRRRIPPVHLYHRHPTLRSLIQQLPLELAKARIRQVPRQAMIAHHPLHVQVLNRNPPVIPGQAMG